jgi:HSP20 family molecular chaperone IbpA
MSNLPVLERRVSPARPRLAAVEWPVPSTEPDTSEVDDSWFADGARHSFIAYTGTRYASTPVSRSGVAPIGAAHELAYDVCDSPHALVVLVDLPGVEAEHLSLTLGSLALFLNVSVPASREPRLGVPAGQYEVRVDAPASLGPDAIDASLRNGLLRIRLSKSPNGARRVGIVADD